MTAPTAAAHEERARDIFRRLFDERDLTDPRWYWADGLVTRLHALDLTLRGPDGMADFFTSLFGHDRWRPAMERSTNRLRKTVKVIDRRDLKAA